MPVTVTGGCDTQQQRRLPRFCSAPQLADAARAAAEEAMPTQAVKCVHPAISVLMLAAARL